MLLMLEGKLETRYLLAANKSAATLLSVSFNPRLLPLAFNLWTDWIWSWSQSSFPSSSFHPSHPPLYLISIFVFNFFVV